MPGWGCTLRTVRGPEKLVLPSAELGQCSSHRSALPNTLLGLHDFLLLIEQKKECHKKDRERLRAFSPFNLWKVRMHSKNTWVHTWTEPRGSVSELVVPGVMGENLAFEGWALTFSTSCCASQWTHSLGPAPRILQPSLWQRWWGAYMWGLSQSNVKSLAQYRVHRKHATSVHHFGHHFG